MTLENIAGNAAGAVLQSKSLRADRDAGSTPTSSQHRRPRACEVSPSQWQMVPRSPSKCVRCRASSRYRPIVGPYVGAWLSFAPGVPLHIIRWPSRHSASAGAERRYGHVGSVDAGQGNDSTPDCKTRPGADRVLEKMRIEHMCARELACCAKLGMGFEGLVLKTIFNHVSFSRRWPHGAARCGRWGGCELLSSDVLPVRLRV